MRFNIIKKSYNWVVAWVIMIPIALYLFFTNIILSIQFTWWMEIKVNWQIDQQKTKQELSNYLLSQNYKINNEDLNIWLQDWLSVVLIKVLVEKDENVAKLSEWIQSLLLEKWIIESKDKITEVSFIWPSIWDYMKNSALKATLLWILFMWIYILIAFSWLKEYVSPLLLAFITMFTMIFDIALPAWAYWILMHFNHWVQVDSVFIIALLTIMWYSINDTIIIFDRVRENFKLNESKIKKWQITYAQIYEDSLWQTMRRSIWTVLATFLAVLAMYIFGSWMMKLFAFTFGLWIIFGSYSSIFISAPMAYILSWKYNKEMWKK